MGLWWKDLAGVAARVSRGGALSLSVLASPILAPAFAHAATDPSCLVHFLDMTVLSGRHMPMLPSSSPSLQEMPGVGNIVTYKLRIDARRARWNAANPKNPNNFPTPEHREVVDVMKREIAGLPASRRVVWDREIAKLEANGLPYTDTAIVNARFAAYLSTRKGVQNSASRVRSVAAYRSLTRK